MSKKEEEKKITIELEEFPEFKQKMMQIVLRDEERSKLLLADVDACIAQRLEATKHNKIIRKLYGLSLLADVVIIIGLIYVGFVK